VRGPIGRIAWLATFLAGAAAFGQQASENRVENIDRIAMGAIGPAALPSDLRTKLEDAAAAGLRASGAEVVSALEVSRARTNAGLGSCADPVCQRRAAELAGAQYWLRGTCQLDVSTYHLHLELVDARSGAVRVARDDTCDICTEADVALTANVAASALKVALARARPSPVSVPLAAAPTPNPVPRQGAGASRDGATAPPSTVTQAVETTAKRPLWLRVLPWAAFTAAAAAIAGGAYYLAIDDRGLDCPEKGHCANQYDTLWQGVPLVALGGALAATGIVLLSVQRGPSEPGPTAPAKVTERRSLPEIMISLDRVAVSGHF
jgi:hypothetical protein